MIRKDFLWWFFFILYGVSGVFFCYAAKAETTPVYVYALFLMIIAIQGLFLTNKR